MLIDEVYLRKIIREEVANAIGGITKVSPEAEAPVEKAPVEKAPVEKAPVEKAPVAKKRATKKKTVVEEVMDEVVKESSEPDVEEDGFADLDDIDDIDEVQEITYEGFIDQLKQMIADSDQGVEEARGLILDHLKKNFKKSKFSELDKKDYAKMLSDSKELI